MATLVAAMKYKVWAFCVLRLILPAWLSSASRSSAQTDLFDPEAPSHTKPPSCPEGDVDRDGLCDAIERATGTRPLRADTDGDGVPDGQEDTDRDGVLDVGESDPRVPGLFPGSYPHIPEPMVFDLVRGLGAKRGEVEVNTLAVLSLRPERSLRWAPEVEWAIRDGVAIEFELPMHDRELEALKSAFQVTLPVEPRNLTHGVQVIVEYLLTSRHTQGTVLYLFGARMARWSILGMAGARALTPPYGRRQYEVLLNPSVYADLTENLTLGLEANFALGLAGSHALAAVPQLHWQVSKRVRIQLGAGPSVVHGRTSPLAAARIVLE